MRRGSLTPIIRIVLSARHKKNHFPDNDPFGERTGWDNDSLIYASWSHIDIDALAIASESKEAQQSHFGDGGVKSTFVLRKAMSMIGVRKANSPGDNCQEASHCLSEEQLRSQQDQDRVENHSKSYQTYEEYASSELATCRAPTIEGGDEEPREMDVPPFLRELRAKEEAGSSTVESIPPRSSSETIVGVNDAETYNFPSCDPLQWTTDDVVAWLEYFAEDGAWDESMSDAFTMIRVDGAMLLNKVMPPDLFKIMRKWHVLRSSGNLEARENALTATRVRSKVIQETIMLCYSYCR